MVQDIIQADIHQVLSEPLTLVKKCHHSSISSNSSEETEFDEFYAYLSSKRDKKVDNPILQ